MVIKRWLSYERKLMSIRSPTLAAPQETLSDDFLKHNLRGITEIEDYVVAFQKFANTLYFKVPEWLVFGHYAEDCMSARVEHGEYQLFYCERGDWRLDADCDSLVELTYVIFNEISPLTESANMLLASLDRIKDQRLVIWLKMSAKIYQAFRINELVGVRKLKENVYWMMDELVRMHVFETHEQAIRSEKHILQGLMLSGMLESFARRCYKALLRY